MSDDTKPESVEIAVSGPVIISPVVISKWYGFWVQHSAMLDQFWGMTCPCGVTVTYAINEFPKVTTKHPCTNPNHWTIQIDLPVVPAEAPVVPVDQPEPTI